MITKGGASALLALMSTGLLWSCSRVPMVEKAFDGNAQTTDQKPDKTLQSFESIPGTPYLVANITQSQWGKSRSSASDSYARGGDIHNLIFLDSGSLESHRLFDTNQYIILKATQYPLSSQGTEQKADKVKKTARFVYQILKEDTNEDKSLDTKDPRTIGISDAFGKQYVEVLTDISQLLNLQALSGDRLLVVYVKSGAKTASIIDLNQRKVVKTNAIANLGPDVQ